MFYILSLFCLNYNIKINIYINKLKICSSQSPNKKLRFYIVDCSISHYDANEVNLKQV